MPSHLPRTIIATHGFDPERERFAHRRDRVHAVGRLHADSTTLAARQRIEIQVDLVPARRKCNRLAASTVVGREADYMRERRTFRVVRLPSNRDDPMRSRLRDVIELGPRLVLGKPVLLDDDDDVVQEVDEPQLGGERER
jgi:hypothetical protein